MILNEYGRIIEKEIIKTEEIRKEIKINNFVIMPNHLHLIIEIENVGNAGPHSLRLKQNINDFTKNYLSNAVQRIKSSITNQIRKQFNDYEFAWQKSFYDVIIRNAEQLNKIIQYIIENPLKRELDKNNPTNLK